MGTRPHLIARKPEFGCKACVPADTQMNAMDVLIQPLSLLLFLSLALHLWRNGEHFN